MSTITADLPTQVTLTAAEREVLDAYLVLMTPELDPYAPLADIRAALDAGESVYRLRAVLHSLAGDATITDSDLVAGLRDAVLSNARDALSGEESRQDAATMATWHTLEDKLQISRRSLALADARRRMR